jgi:hypothetical protein
VAVIRALRGLCEKHSMAPGFAFASAGQSSRVVQTLFFRVGELSYLCTDVFGISIRAAGMQGARNQMSHFGTPNLMQIYSGMLVCRQRWAPQVGEHLSYGSARLMLVASLD